MIALRAAAAVAGMLALVATAHVTIEASGGYGTAHAVLTLAIALGAGVGALCIGAAWDSNRVGLAVWLGIALAAGEIFGLLLTGERIVAAREVSQAPARSAQADHGRARQRLADAEQSMNNLRIPLMRKTREGAVRKV